MTPQEIADNRSAAIATVRSSLGLSGLAVDRWTVEQRIDYNKALAAYILAHPALFTADESYIAQTVNSQPRSTGTEVGLLSNLQVFGSALLDEGEKTLDSVGDIGRGVRETLSMIGKLLPFAVLAMALLYFFKTKKDYDAARRQS